MKAPTSPEAPRSSVLWPYTAIIKSIKEREMLLEVFAASLSPQQTRVWMLGGRKLICKENNCEFLEVGN